MQSQTVTQPVISAGENGPGAADTETTVYDTYGRPIWEQDADGFLTYTAYDPATGAVVETITDVNTSDTGDFSDLPAGWTTPAGGGLNLVTTYQVDALGRTTGDRPQRQRHLHRLRRRRPRDAHLCRLAAARIRRPGRRR